MKKYVEDNKITDVRQMPSVREAVNRLTAAERQQVGEDDAYQRGLREGEMRARLGSMPRPASAAAAMNASNTQAPSTIDEALSPESISQDQELMQMLSDLSHAGADLTTGGTR
jgi:glutamate/tyrosine decarboxylase-like PLP-dependent enzyme